MHIMFDCQNVARHESGYCCDLFARGLRYSCRRDLGRTRCCAEGLSCCPTKQGILDRDLRDRGIECFSLFVVVS